MTGKEIVREVICLLKGGERWTKGTLYAKESGEHVFSQDEAARFCLIGAGLKVTGESNSSGPQMQEFLKLVEPLIARKAVPSRGFNGRRVASFNDSRTTFDEVETILAKALLRANKKPKTDTV